MLPIDTTLQDLATLYVTGAMTAEAREAFEVVLGYHHDLRRLVAELAVTATLVAVAGARSDASPRPELKARILNSITSVVPKPTPPEGWLVTNADGEIQWVNSALTDICGYSLEELKGKKPGRMLQGPATDPAAVERIRTALRERRSCRETLANYHKDGSCYLAEVKITPILDGDREPLWFVARETKVATSE